MVSPAYMEESASPLVSYASRRIDAANRLVTSFSYLCGRAARKFLRSGLERCDLEQVAAIGLIKASRRYDAGTRTPFEAYAWLVIVGELMHYVRDYEFGIRIPRALLELEREVAAAQDALAVRLEREPTTAEIADVLGVSAMAVARARRIRSVARPLAGRRARRRRPLRTRASVPEARRTRASRGRRDVSARPHASPTRKRARDIAEARVTRAPPRPRQHAAGLDGVAGCSWRTRSPHSSRGARRRSATSR